MTDPDDPFGLMNDAGRTRIRPAGGRAEPEAGRARPAPQAWEAPRLSEPRPIQPPSAPPSARQPRAHPNPLVAAFAPLLELAPELEQAGAPPSAETLRVRLYDTLIRSRDAAVARGVPLARADQAAWFVAALIDDLAINTPWGGHGDWPRQPLVVSLSGDVDAGSRFFERLDELQRYPERDPELLELAHLCLGLGFRGRFRVAGPQSQGALLQARTTTARLLRSADADRAPLSPRWEGVDAPNAPRRFAVPLWTILLATATVVSGIYVALDLRLAEAGSELATVAATVPPAVRVEIVRSPPATPPSEAPPPAPVQPVSLEMLPLFMAAAPPEAASALSGADDVGGTTLVVRGKAPEVFRPARADVRDEYLPLIRSIARTILANREVIGGVTVIGYTDSDPVSATNPFTSNQGLSEARAETIARLLAEDGVPAEMLRSEGRADRDPVGDNATRDGKALNRRVEIRIEKCVTCAS